MSRPRLNILRNLRIQMKTGFLRDQPAEYDYLRRFPPLSRDTLPQSLKTKEVFIPYVDLYHKAVARNPMYLDEKVYPAFGHQEPQALVIAKRQYQYMSQDGMTEESAYRKALEYVNEVEDESFQQLQRVEETLKQQHAKAPFLADPTIAATVETWQNKLKEVTYEQLTLAEQGELDYFVQTSILKWNEVERERRMKDPIFVLRFKKVVESLFPKTQEQQIQAMSAFQAKFRENFFCLYNSDPNKLETMQSFYVEDYLKYIQKTIQQPDLTKWNHQEREDFSKWIIDTLAYRDGIENRSTNRIQKYLDSIRDQFFPMLRFPHRAPYLKTYTVDEVKALLYHNQIGYKKEVETANGNDGKLFVKRFYKLPMLLFGRDVLCANITLNERYLSRMVESKDALTNELSSHGVDANVDEVHRQLSDYHEEFMKSQKVVSQMTSDEIDMSILDDILGEDKGKKAAAAVQAATVASTDATKSSSSAAPVDVKADREKLFEKAGISAPKNELEKERHRFYSQVELQTFENIATEDDVANFKQIRLENELIVRARLAKEYETKEAARRLADWEKRGLWTSELPPPNVPLVE